MHLVTNCYRIFFIFAITTTNNKMGEIIGLDGKAIINEKALSQYTNANLVAMFNEFKNLNRGLLGLMLRSKLREFYQDNYLRYETIVKRLEQVETNYFVFEPNESGKDKVKFEVVDIDGKDIRRPVLLEGATMEDYQKATDEIMNEVTTIKI